MFSDEFVAKLRLFPNTTQVLSNISHKKYLVIKRSTLFKDNVLIFMLFHPTKNMCLAICQYQY